MTWLSTETPDGFPAASRSSTRLVIPRSLARADVIVAVSKNTAEDIEDLFGVPASQISVVPHGVSHLFRPMSREDLVLARARLQLPERFVLFVGTIEPRKNLGHPA